MQVQVRRELLIFQEPLLDPKCWIYNDWRGKGFEKATSCSLTGKQCCKYGQLDVRKS